MNLSLSLSYLQHHVLLTEEGEVEAAVGGVDTPLLGLTHVKHGLVQVKVSGNEITCDLIFIRKNEIIKP